MRPYFGLGLMMAFLEQVCMDDGLGGEWKKVGW